MLDNERAHLLALRPPAAGRIKMNKEGTAKVVHGYERQIVDVTRTHKIAWVRMTVFGIKCCDSRSWLLMESVSGFIISR